MQHDTDISQPPVGNSSSLMFTGKKPGGGQRQISVHKDSNLAGSAATGSCKSTTANIKVSNARFTELSTRPVPFTIVIDADASGNVSACTVKPAQQNAA